MSLDVDIEFGYHCPIGSLQQEFLPGMVYGVSGRNGAGKTTLLRTLGGQLAPVSGTLRLNDENPLAKENLGAISFIGAPVFYPDLTVGEHFEILRRSSGQPLLREQEVWRIDEFLQQPVLKLSSGQQQRFSLASQLGLNATVFAVDEPERHLDSTWISVLVSELRKLAAAGKLVILSTHSTALLDHCDETISLD